MADLHVQIHRMELASLPSLRDRLRAAIYRAPDTLPDTARQRALSLLDELPERNTVCHADFHVENIMLTDEHALAIDWPNAGRGLPAFDVMRSALMIAIGESPDALPILLRPVELIVRKLMLNAYLIRYLEHTDLTRVQLQGVALPVLAARFAEPIPEELPARLRVLTALEEGRTVF